MQLFRVLQKSRRFEFKIIHLCRMNEKINSLNRYKLLFDICLTFIYILLVRIRTYRDLTLKQMNIVCEAYELNPNEYRC